MLAVNHGRTQDVQMGGDSRSEARAGPSSDLGSRIARRLKALRTEHRCNQATVARALGISPTAVSRLEWGRRRLRVDHLTAWAAALGYRVDVVIWGPTPPEKPSGARPEPPPTLDDECAEVLAEVASAIRHLPGPARLALIGDMREWRADAVRRAAGHPDDEQPRRRSGGER